MPRSRTTGRARASASVLAVATLSVLVLVGCSSSGNGSPATAATGTSGPGQGTGDAYLAKLKAQLATFETQTTPWSGPTSGPKAVRGKSIIYIPDSESVDSSRIVGNAVQQAAREIGWKFRLIDGQGTASGQTAAFEQAIALKPDGIVLGSIDAVQEATEIAKANAAGIVVVGYHSASDPGPIPGKLFANVTTNPDQVAEAAADLAVVASGGTAGVVIFTDSEYQIGIRKSTDMEKIIQNCSGCKVLDYVDTPIADTSTRMGSITANLILKYGKQWTWGLGINDSYFDYASPAAASAGLSQSGPLQFVSAGDGSTSAFQRIRNGSYQVGTVAEPLNEDGWQAIDELNRAFNKAPWSGFVPPVHLVTKSNIGTQGGPQNTYDPNNDYKQHYQSIWGVG